jgi:uncharacterized protein YceK
MKALPIVFVAVLLLFGCATTYQHQGLTGGYTDTQLGENLFRVTFRGNGYTRPERAADLALLRCAELALQHGFQYFVVIDAASYSKQETYTTPTQTTTTGSASVVGNSIYGSSTSTTYGGQAFTTSKPRETDTIVCFKDKPDVNGLVYDANFLVTSLKQQYNIKD